jgi:hypothetical protein
MANPTTISLDVEQYKAVAEGINTTAVTLVVTAKNLLDRGLQSDEDYTAAVDLAIAAGKREKEQKDNFEPLCSYLHKAHKSATGLRDKYAKPWTLLKDALVAASKRWYMDALEAKKQQEREISRVAQAQSRGLVEEAQELMDQGDVKAARVLLDRARTSTAVVLPSAVPRVEGARVTDKWKASCTDLMAVITEIAAGRMDLMWETRGEMRPLVIVDQVVLNAIVSRKGDTLQCPGITVEPDVQIGATR